MVEVASSHQLATYHNVKYHEVSSTDPTPTLQNYWQWRYQLVEDVD